MEILSLLTMFQQNMYTLMEPYLAWAESCLSPADTLKICARDGEADVPLEHAHLNLEDPGGYEAVLPCWAGSQCRT